MIEFSNIASRRLSNNPRLYNIIELFKKIINRYKYNKNFVEYIFPSQQLIRFSLLSDFFKNRVILFPRNNIVIFLNRDILNRLYKLAQYYLFIDIFDIKNIKYALNLKYL